MSRDENIELETLPGIFEREAVQLLGMVAGSGLDIVPADLLDGPHAADVIGYIGEIFVRAYCLSECAVIVCSDRDKAAIVKGYAMVFQRGDAPAFLHCARIMPQYLDDLSHDQLIDDVLECYPLLLTLCHPEDVPFFERHGFWYAGRTEIPPRHNFLLAQQLYGDTVMMARGDKTALDVPAFMLNDRNLRTIKTLALGV